LVAEVFKKACSGRGETDPQFVRMENADRNVKKYTLLFFSDFPNDSNQNNFTTIVDQLEPPGDDPPAIAQPAVKDNAGRRVLC
jgi:hypothetical protein